MKTALNWIFTLAACTLLTVATSRAQDAPRPETDTVTLITTGDVTITKANGKTAVVINFVPGKPKSSDTRITISGPYTLDVNGGAREVKGPQGLELHVLSHEDLRLEAPEISNWEHAHKFTEFTACGKIPNFQGCGNPICDQFGHPKDQCRYNSESGCACAAPNGGPCAE
ncbi:MAG: hypothetical protein WBV46_06725 [Terriglobales bacterium]|jgi:hypothetical protein